MADVLVLNRGAIDLYEEALEENGYTIPSAQAHKVTEA